MVAIVAIAAKIVPLVKWVDRLNNMVMLLDRYCEFTHCSLQNQNLGVRIFLINSTPPGFCSLFLSGDWRVRSHLTLTVLPLAIGAAPRLYGEKMMLLILLILLLSIGSLLTQVLVLLPISWFGWLHLPDWLSLTLIVLGISWCLED